MDTASPPSPLTSPSGYGMVEEMELDAAVALANLAGQAAAGESRKQSVSPAQGLFSSFSSSAAAAADDRETEERFKHCSAMAGTSSVKLSAGRGTRQGLTEAEKEERRIRRVLANRESARQTIRRRQALRDELTKKVAYLRLENDTMKLEKESAMEEYLSLRHANAQLKEQIANTARGEIDMNSAAADVRPPCAWFQLLPGGESSLVPCRSEAGAEKEAAAVDDKGKQTGWHQIQTPDEVLHTTAAAAAAEARKRRKELTKLKQRHAR